MNLSFENKVALVTGAASGMGLVTAKAFAEAGAAVALSDVNENAVRSAAEELVASGHKAIGIRCNVADEADVAAMVAQTVSTFGCLDAAFNNAGIQSPAMEIADVPGEEFDRVNGINLRGVWNCMKYELRQMREQGSGAIVNNSSIGGLIGLPGRATYHATKHGVIGLTKSAALEYAARGIRINAICPGIINTPMVAEMLAKEPEAMKQIMRDQPIGRLGESEEIASAVLWLCSGGASFVILPNVLSAHAVGFGMSAPRHQYPAIYLIGTLRANEQAIFSSIDEGASWTRINDDEHQYGTLSVVAGDPRIYGRVYVGTNGRGVLYGDPRPGGDDRDDR